MFLVVSYNYRTRLKYGTAYRIHNVEAIQFATACGRFVAVPGPRLSGSEFSVSSNKTTQESTVCLYDGSSYLVYSFTLSEN